MKFIVEEEYMGGDATKPHPLCRKEVVTYLDFRTCKTLSEARKHEALSRYWFDAGENHREEDGMVVRDMPGEEVWVVDIETIEELVEMFESFEIADCSYKEIKKVIRLD